MDILHVPFEIFQNEIKTISIRLKIGFLKWRKSRLRWLIKAMRDFFLFCSLNIISCSNNLLFCSHKKYSLLPQHINLFPQYIILFPQHIILLPQYSILFPQHIILFPQYIILFRSKMATGGKNSLTLDLMGNTFKYLLRRNYWVNWNQT